MTRMLPPVIPDAIASHAEEKLFGLIKRELSNDWTALYSVGLKSHPDKRWAEVDFLLVGPDGVFCLEVKGGRVARQDGLWEFTDRWGEVHRKREGPFEQAAGAAAALRHYLLRTGLYAIERAAFGYGVIVPDIPFKVEGPDIAAQVVYDARDGERPFADYVNRLAAYTRDRTRTIQGYAVEPLSAKDCEGIINAVRPDFDLRPSLRMQIGKVNRELLRLTHEQYRVLDELEENPRIIVRGGAGSGKTLLAVEEARRRAARGEKVLLCCFNKRLAAYLKNVLGKASGIDVWHLHGLMASLVTEAGLSGRLPRAQEADLFAKFYPGLTVEALLTLNRAEMYDALIVDEAQDLLLDSYLDVFDALLKGNLDTGQWRFFLDPNQDLFGGTGQRAMQKLNGLHPVRAKLTLNCRNSRPIGVATAILSGAQSDDTLTIEGPEVEQYWYHDAAQERREVSRRIGRMLSEGIAPAEIVILSRYRRENSCMREGLLDLPYILMDIDESERTPRRQGIRFATIGSYKGLESDAVIVTDVDDLEQDSARLAAYVGASRAKALLIVFLNEKLRETYAVKAKEYGRRLAERIDESDGHASER